MQHIIYLHGFLSSPMSEKARQTQAFFKKHYPSINLHAPRLPGNIDRAVDIIDSLVKTLPANELRFIGSSMGGFLSNYFVEKYGGKAVLVNPAVEPFRLLVDYMGKHINPYSGEVFYITPENISHLYGYYSEQVKKPDNYMVLLQTGDETLDYRTAAEKFRNSHLYIEQGGDHSFVDYHQWLPKIIAFLR
ncbi:YqiA/YcfP family alpha/beta fold hydrolase [Glaciecola sp. 1036]|uniref:YqiA/YcfP family alpha/beta fold hydrolase n=1 Tax=Alteromonadaceae TaxID=72275 RepID=UPI003CFC554D